MRRAVNHTSPAWAKLVIIGLCLAIALWLIPNAYKVLLSDVYSLNAKNTIANYGNKNIFDLNQWIEARRQLERALSVTPDDPNLLFSMGQLNAIRGYKAKGSQTISRVYYEEASLFYEMSLKIRPRDALTWVNLLIVLDTLNVESNRFNLTLQQAQKLSTHEKSLADVVNNIAFKHGFL